MSKRTIFLALVALTQIALLISQLSITASLRRENARLYDLLAQGRVSMRQASETMDRAKQALVNQGQALDHSQDALRESQRALALQGAALERCVLAVQAARR